MKKPPPRFELEKQKDGKLVFAVTDDQNCRTLLLLSKDSIKEMITFVIGANIDAL